MASLPTATLYRHPGGLSASREGGTQGELYALARGSLIQPIVPHAAQGAFEAQGAPLLFVYLLHFARYMSGDAESHKDAVVATVSSPGIPAIDIDPFLTRTDSLDAFPNGLPGHCGQQAYRRVARAIRDWIERH